MGRGDSNQTELDLDVQRVAADDLGDLMPPPEPPPPPTPGFLERRRLARVEREEAQARQLEERRLQAEQEEQERLQREEQERQEEQRAKQARLELEHSLPPEERQLCENCRTMRRETAPDELVSFSSADGEVRFALCKEHADALRSRYQEAQEKADPSHHISSLLSVYYHTSHQEVPWGRQKEWFAVIDHLSEGRLSDYTAQIHREDEERQQRQREEEERKERWLNTLPEESQRMARHAFSAMKIGDGPHYKSEQSLDLVFGLARDLLTVIEQQHGSLEKFEGGLPSDSD